MYILDGLLEHQTRLRPVEIMADTAGVSEVVFGLFWLLGYQFSPRLADIGEARFWRLDPTADYGVLHRSARTRVNTKLIRQNWDDVLRVAGSLHQGTVSASELMRSLLRSKRPSTLARALAALGRIPKTLYLLTYIDDESYRRRILTQLHRGDSRHSVARAVLHGQRGANCGSGIAKGRRINWGHSAWSSMRSCYGIPSTWRPRSRRCVRKGSPCWLQMSPASPPWCINTSTFKDGTLLRCLRR